MPDTFRILGQKSPGAATETAIYLVPPPSQLSDGHVTVCNRGAATTFRISVSLMGAATALKDYLAYDVPIAANDVYDSVRFSANSNDVVRVYAGSGNLSFSCFGKEVVR